MVLLANQQNKTYLALQYDLTLTLVSWVFVWSLALLTLTVVFLSTVIFIKWNLMVRLVFCANWSHSKYYKLLVVIA